MDHDDDGETSYNTFVDDVAFEVRTYIFTSSTDSSWAQRRNTHSMLSSAVWVV